MWCKLLSNNSLKKKKNLELDLTLFSAGSDQLLRPTPVSAEWHCGDGERKIAQANANNSGSTGHNWRPCQGRGHGPYRKGYTVLIVNVSPSFQIKPRPYTYLIGCHMCRCVKGNRLPVAGAASLLLGQWQCPRAHHQLRREIRLRVPRELAAPGHHATDRQMLQNPGETSRLP